MMERNSANDEVGKNDLEKHGHNTMLSEKTVKIIRYLQTRGIDPILYGSRGVSLYLGKFKEFGDMDLLIEGRWLTEKWGELEKIMRDQQFVVSDLHEHEFTDKDGFTVGFGDVDILRRDGIVDAINKVKRIFVVSGVKITTLSPETFLAVYKYSQKDGYRQKTRGKKDSITIKMLEQYLAR